MSKKLTKEELKKKMEFHEKKVIYYKKKIETIEKNARRIGFVHYD
ncbi:hypothetical protein [Seonamhaeicola sp.]